MEIGLLDGDRTGGFNLLVENVILCIYNVDFQKNCPLKRLII